MYVCFVLDRRKSVCDTYTYTVCYVEKKKKNRPLKYIARHAGYIVTTSFYMRFTRFVYIII